MCCSPAVRGNLCEALRNAFAICARPIDLTTPFQCSPYQHPGNNIVWLNIAIIVHDDAHSPFHFHWTILAAGQRMELGSAAQMEVDRHSSLLADFERKKQAGDIIYLWLSIALNFLRGFRLA
jgi:hypothetical protein